MSIELVPDLKKLPHIYGAHKDEKLVIFVGAGISALWGCKRWKDMATALIDSCYERGSIDYWARETLLTKYSSAPRKLITIAKNILNENYLGELRKTLQLTHERKAKLPDLFNNLFSLQAIYITTNIDDNFSSLFDKGNVHFDPSKFSLAILKPKNIVHLHGVIHNPESLVMTVDEYIDRYQNNGFRDFLESTFFDEKYCFLFIGYGVDEMEIINFMIQKYSKGVKSLRGFLNRFYILLPFFHNEEPLFKYEQLYFDQINMSVIPYSINAKGYDQLEDKRSRWEDVTGFFWSISGRILKKEEKDKQEEPSEDFKKKILAFWEWTVNEQEFVKGKLGDAYSSFLCRMAELTIWLDKIDDTTEKWLMLSSPFIEIEHRSTFLLNI